MLLPQNYWLVFCFLHYIVFKVLLPDFPVFMLFFGALLFAIVSRDSLFSIAIGVRFVNHFFDLFFKVLTLLDLVLPALLWCSIILLLSKSKCKCFLHIPQSFLLSCISLSAHPQRIGFLRRILLSTRATTLVALTTVRFLLYSI